MLRISRLQQSNGSNSLQDRNIDSIRRFRYEFLMSMEVTHAETYTLLLRELITGTSRVAVITGQDGIVDGLSVATYFAGCVQFEFLGGAYVMACRFAELADDVAAIVASQMSPRGKTLLVIDDRNFPNPYSLSPRLLLDGRPELSIIVVSRNPDWITGDDFRINLSYQGHEQQPHILHLNHGESD